MSNFFLADRIKEISRVQGTGSISLDGAAAGFSAFGDFYASGDLVFYAITDNVKYEVGSGIFKSEGSTKSITRNPIRSSSINIGPWYVNGTSNSGPTSGNTGYFYPLWLSRSAAQSGIGFGTGPFSSVSGVTFNEHPGITFYYTAQHFASGVGALGGSGANYATSGQPVSFGVGVKEVFVTYPGKTAVYNAAGIEAGIKEPKESGIAFWKNEQIINYTSNLVWNDSKNFLGVNKSNPAYAIDVGGSLSNGIVRASGFIDGGSGILFSGGQLTDTLLTASGGRQWEPFLRNRKGSAAEGVIELSGIVDQIIDFAPQPVATVFAGPISGVCNPCPDDVPTFRRLVASDLPTITELQNLWSSVSQQNIGLDNQTANITPNNFVPGMIPIYHSSGNITYDSGIFYDATNNRLVIGGNAATDTASYTLDLKGAGTLSAVSASIVTISATSGIFTNISAISGSLTALNYLSSNSGDISNLSSVSGTINNLVLTSGNALMLVSKSGDILTLSSTSGYFDHIIFNNNLIRIGTNAANNTSGVHNIYLGFNAGVAVSGSENIEIVASGSNPSFLTHQASGKINIGNTIVGDIYSARVTIGEPDDASPDATLHVRPRISTEPAFIVQHQGIGSNTVPYMQLQSGDSTTFYRVTNSGDVITSGYLNPSGGLLLEPITPANWMNSTANRLYNDGGTLKFNGSTITVGGSYSFYLTDGKQAADQITDSQTVTVSGVSGIEVAYDPTGGGFFRVSASGLSGVLQNQITAQTYTFYSAASGYGSNNNDPNIHYADSYLVVSGVSGIKIDYLDLDDGTNSSGIFVVGYDPTVTYSFNVTNGDVANDTIANTQTITVSGVSGIRVEYDSTNNFFRIGASGLSGVLNSTINNSGNFLYGQILQSTASGLAISGIAAYASGKIDGFTQQSATSGIKVENNTYITDSGNRATFSSLVLNSSGSIVVGAALSTLPVSGNHKDSVMIGFNAGTNANNIDSGIMLGYYAGFASTGALDSVMIGKWAGRESTSDSTFESSFGNKSIFLGYQAGYLSTDNIYNIAVGAEANKSASGDSYYNIDIGTEAGSLKYNSRYIINLGVSAGKESLNNLSCIHIGEYAGMQSKGGTSVLSIGDTAGYFASGCDNSVNLGTQAGSTASGCVNSIHIGIFAGYYSSSNVSSIFIADRAGYLSSGIFRGTVVGPYAGYRAYDTDYSVFIGNSAGSHASGIKNSISIQKDTGETRDFQWIDSPGTNDYLDIGKGIQGLINPGGSTLHIGKPLFEPPFAAGNYHTIYDIQDAALNLTPPSNAKGALTLFLHPSDTIGNSNQSAYLFRTQWKDTGTSIPYSSFNGIINQHGLLKLPLATSKVGTGSSAQLRDVNGDTITRGEGVLALYEFSATDKGLAVCLSVNHNGQSPYQWYKINTTTTF